MTTTQALTLQLGERIARRDFHQFPQVAVNIVACGFVDCVGVMIAGMREDPARLLDAALDAPAGRCELAFTGRSARPADAAWINGTAAHALDFDDAALRSHPSAVMVPAILAEAQDLGASGRDMVTAYVAGYETWAELAYRDPQQLVRKGWHPTAVLGAVGAAAACASLRRLSPIKTSHALALAASQSCGLVANFGSMTKPFHAGRAAHAGVSSARLADAGFTGSLDALESPQGLLMALSPGGLVDLSRSLLTSGEWHIVQRGLSIKKYPMCFCTHRAIDAVLEMRQQLLPKTSQIRRIVASISQRNALILHNHQPNTPLECKFSMEFALAAALLAGSVTFPELTPEFIDRPDVRAMMARVEVQPLTEEDPLSGHAPHDWVTVHLEDGSVLESRRIRFARGAYEEPLNAEELKAKFQTCVDYASTQLDGEALFNCLRNIGELDNARDLQSAIFWKVQHA